MPRNGQGVYSKPEGTTAVPNTTIESAKYNQVIDDLVNDANDARPISAGGTGAKTVAKVLENLGLDTINNTQNTRINEALSNANKAILIAEGKIGSDGGTTGALTVSTLTVNTSAVINAMRVNLNSIFDGPATVNGTFRATDQAFMSKSLSVGGSVAAESNVYSGSAYLTTQGEIFGNIWGTNFGHQNLSSVIHDLKELVNTRAGGGALCQYQSALIESPQSAITTGAGGQVSQLSAPYVMIGVRIEFGLLYARGVALKNQ